MSLFFELTSTLTACEEKKANELAAELERQPDAQVELLIVQHCNAYARICKSDPWPEYIQHVRMEMRRLQARFIVFSRRIVQT